MRNVLSAVKGFLTSYSGWAIVCCAAGIGSTFLRWNYVSVPGWDPGWVSGIDQKLWYGKGIAVGLLCLALVLIATHSTTVLARWKPLLLGVCGAIFLGVLISWYVSNWTTVRSVISGRLVSEEHFVHPVGEGVYVAFSSAIGLMLIAALQLRSIWLRRESASCAGSGPA